MHKHNVVVTYSASAEQKALLFETLGKDTSLTFLDEISSSQREQALEDATILLSWNFSQEIPFQDYSRLQQVTFIQLISAGVDHMPFANLPSHIVVAGNVGAYASPMAEHVMAMMLALAKRLLIENQNMKNGEFNQQTLNRSLFGMTAGIIGFGGIGRATARLMCAFGMQIYAITQSGASSEPTEFIGTLHDLEYVLRTSNVVVLSLPLSRATRGLIGKDQLAWMKPDAILVNVARGAIIDEEALFTHVKNHPNFMVGIDAWWREPFSHGTFHMDYPWLELPNVLGSPHNSGVVPHILSHAVQQAAKNVKRIFEGEQPTGVMRREDYL